MSQVRIAVAGCGLIGREHISRIIASERAVLAATVDPTAEAANYATEIGSVHFSDLDALLEAEIADAVILATPNHLHAAQATQLIEAGLTVLVEKPITHSLETAQALVELVQAKGGRLLVGHHRAHSPIMREAQRIVEAGTLGRLVGIQGSATFYKPEHYFDAAPWRTQKGGGPILINLIHEIGNLRQIAGEIEAVEAISSNATRQFEVEDTAAILFRFTSGALATFLLSDATASARSWEQTSRENPSYSTYADEDCYVISGTQGTLSVPTMRIKRFAEGVERSWWKELETSVHELKREDPLVLQLEHFCDLALGLAEPRVSAFDGMQNLRVVDAIERSIASAKLIQL